MRTRARRWLLQPPGEPAERSISHDKTGQFHGTSGAQTGAMRWLCSVVLASFTALGCDRGSDPEPMATMMETPDAALPEGTGVIPKQLTCEDELESFRGHIPACSAETRGCVEACAGDDACVAECIEADTTPPATAPNGLILDCTLCISWQTVVCVEQAGCQEQASALSCCRDSLCRDAEDIGACSATMCADERFAYSDCLSARALHCIQASTAGDFEPCFAEAP
jgi:hypothetical protein